MLSKVTWVLGVTLPYGCSNSVPKYGSNPAAGRTFDHDGIQLYYEVYGAGEPLLLVHGNAGSIGNFKAQINHFRTRYRVIAMDAGTRANPATAQARSRTRRWRTTSRRCSIIFKRGQRM